MRRLIYGPHPPHPECVCWACDVARWTHYGRDALACLPEHLHQPFYHWVAGNTAALVLYEHDWRQAVSLFIMERI